MGSIQGSFQEIIKSSVHPFDGDTTTMDTFGDEHAITSRRNVIKTIIFRKLQTLWTFGDTCLGCSGQNICRGQIYFGDKAQDRFMRQAQLGVPHSRIQLSLTLREWIHGGKKYPAELKYPTKRTRSILITFGQIF